VIPASDGGSEEEKDRKQRDEKIRGQTATDSQKFNKQ